MMDELASVVTDAASVKAVDKIASQVASAAGSSAPDEKGAQTAWEKQRKTMLQVRAAPLHLPPSRVVLPLHLDLLIISPSQTCADVRQQPAAAARWHPLSNCTPCSRKPIWAFPRRLVSSRCMHCMILNAQLQHRFVCLPRVSNADVPAGSLLQPPLPMRVI